MPGTTSPVCPVLHFHSEQSNKAWLLSYRGKNLQFHSGTLKQFPLIQTTLWGSALIVLILSSFLICFTTLFCKVDTHLLLRYHREVNVHLCRSVFFPPKSKNSSAGFISFPFLPPWRRDSLKSPHGLIICHLNFTLRNKCMQGSI